MNTPAKNKTSAAINTAIRKAALAHEGMTRGIVEVMSRTSMRDSKTTFNLLDFAKDEQHDLSDFHPLCDFNVRRDAKLGACPDRALRGAALLDVSVFEQLPPNDPDEPNGRGDLVHSFHVLVFEAFGGVFVATGANIAESMATYGITYTGKAEHMLTADAEVPAAACLQCGGWTSFGGMSQHVKATAPVMGRVGCICGKFKVLNKGFCSVCELRGFAYAVEGFTGYIEACTEHRVQLAVDAIKDGAMKPEHRTHDDVLGSAYVLKELTPNGTLWTSPESFDGDGRHAQQNVRTSWSSGSVRWAERLVDGAFIYGLDKNGKELRGTNDICGCRNNAPASAPGDWHLTTCEVGKKLEAAQVEVQP